VNQLEPKDRNIAMVFQNYAIYPHMSVAKNIAFGLYTSGLSEADKRRRVEEWARSWGWRSSSTAVPSELSGGQRQRVAIGPRHGARPRGLPVRRAPVDLDAQLRAQMRLEIKRLHQQLGTTIVFVTHDQVEAMTMADRIVVMRDGRILQAGPPMEVYERPADVFTAQFIGSPTMNIVPARLTGSGVEWGVGAPRSPLTERAGPHRGRARGIRPQDLTIVENGQQPGVTIEGRVSVVEPLGSEAFVHVEAGDRLIVATTSPKTMPAVGSAVRLGAAPQGVHLFDARTERAL
jgi:multiple sugar transport system ATP-binding protein